MFKLVTATLYYANSLPEVRRIIDTLFDDGVLVKRAKEAVNEPSLLADLVYIKESYENLIFIMDNFDKSRYTIYSGHEILSNINFKTDPVNIKMYVESRLNDNDARTIARLTNEDISPTIYQLLRECPPTSISVERSFSMLKKLLAKDRNFDKKHVFDYIFCNFNSKVKENEIWDVSENSRSEKCN